MAGKIIIAELDLNTDALTKKAVVTKKAIQDLKDAQKILKIQGDQNSKAFVKNEVALKKLTTSYREQTKVLSSLTDENDEFIQTEKAINSAVTKNITTISQARKSNKELLAVRNELNLSTIEGQKQLTRINAKLDSNNKIIKENVSGYEKQKIGIGNYTGALGKFFPRISSAITQGIAFKESLVLQKQAMQASTTATGLASKALRIFKIALISTGIGAIVVAIGSLIAAFSSTQKGADAISKALAPIKGAFEGIIGVIQSISLNVFGQLGDRFTLVKNTMLNGIDTIRLGWNKLTGDTKEAAEIQGRLVERTIESTEAQARLNVKVGELVNVFKSAGNRISEAADAQQRIVGLTIQIENAENRLTVSRSVSNRIIKESNKIAEDTTKNLKDREVAAARGIEESNKLLKAEQNILDLKIKALKLTQGQNDTDRKDNKELAELQAKRNEVETQQLELQTTLTNKLNIIRKQAETEQLKTSKEKTDSDKKKNDDELKRTATFEARKKQLKDEIDLANAEDDLQKELLKSEQDYQKHLLDLENLEVTETEKNELRKLLAIRHEGEIEDIKEANRQKSLNAEKKFAKTDLTLAKNLAKSKIDFQRKVTGVLSSIFGDGVGARIAATVAEATAGIIRIQGTTAASQAANLAAATAVGFPQNIPLIIGAKVQNAGLSIQSKIAQGQLLKTTALNSVTSAFDGGGVAGGGNGKITQGSNIPTQKGGDNILATLKTGEVVLNESQQERAGGSAFFSSIGVPGFATGGVAGVNSTVTAPIQQAGNDISNLANKIVDGINDIKVVTVVDDVTNAQAIQTEVVNGADI